MLTLCRGRSGKMAVYVPLFFRLVELPDGCHPKILISKIFLFALKNAQPISISISVAKDLSENDIAKLVENALKKNAPRGVKVKRVNGENVLVKYKHRFSLTLLTNTVSDLDVALNKE